MPKHHVILAGALGLLLAGSAQAQEPSNANFVGLNGEEYGAVAVTPTEDGTGIAIKGDLTGLPPGEHGFHIHETGTCDPAAKFESAGAHFNPEGKQHGKENPEGAHAGDLDNITVAEDGTATVDLTHAAALTAEGLLDADGSALMIHADPDDYKTDPSGNSGDRIACAVVTPQP